MVIKPAVVYYNVNSGEVLRVRMNQTISSETARVGDQFSTTVVDPVYSGGVEVIPAGSIVSGRVTTVDRASRKSKSGSIGVHFVAVRLPTGISRPLNGDLADLSGGEMNSDNEGEVSGNSATKRNVVFIRWRATERLLALSPWRQGCRYWSSSSAMGTAGGCSRRH